METLAMLTSLFPHLSPSQSRPTGSLRSGRATYVLAILTCLLCVGIEPKPASSNPFFVGRFDGLIGGPLDTRPFALYWNPANLDTEGLHVDLHLGLIGRQASYLRALPADTPEELVEANGGMGTTSSGGVLPSLAVQWGRASKSGLRYGLGGGVYIARAGTADWDRHPDAPTAYPGAYDGPQRWSALSTYMLVLNYSLGTSIGYGPLSIGAALSYAQARLSTTKASNADQTDDLVNGDGDLKEGRVFLDDAQGDGLHLTLGARVDWAPISIGISWRQEVVYQLEGETTILFADAETNANAGVELQVAGNWLGSVGWTVNKALRLRFEVERQLWSLMDQQIITNLEGDDTLLILERHFKDTMAYRTRADWSVAEALTIHFGGSFEEGATPDEYHEPGLSEYDHVQGGVGVTWALSSSLSLHSSLIWQHFFDRVVTTSAQKPSTNGTYKDDRQYLATNLMWTF
jgi:hypothetical protein